MRDLRPHVLDEGYRIGEEALVNAFRHSRAEGIEAQFIYSDANLRKLDLWSHCGASTEIELMVPGPTAYRQRSLAVRWLLVLQAIKNNCYYRAPAQRKRPAKTSDGWWSPILTGSLENVSITERNG